MEIFSLAKESKKDGAKLNVSSNPTALLAVLAALALLVMSIVILSQSADKNALIVFFTSLAIVVTTITIMAVNSSGRRIVDRRTQEAAQLKQDTITQEQLAVELIQFIDTANAPIFGIDADGRVNEWNQQAANITGFSKSEVMGRDLVHDFITDDYKASVRDVLQNALQGTETANYEFPLFTKEKRQVDVLLNATTRRDIDRNIVGVIGVGQDITELREKDNALRQSQKMEAVGQLTGGIAHDFNNLLTVIIGNLIFLRDDLDLVDAENAEVLNDAICAAQDGAELTQSLLRFSRTSTLEPVTCNVSESILKSARFLSRTLGENIELATNFASDDLKVYIDSVQFENALLNLALNSRDAMKEGGKITISTSLHDQNAKDELGTGLAPGRYVRITISDNGSGIDPAILPNIFEPFFSTKERGRGTGLGLSMVYGFTQQSGGTCLIDKSDKDGTAISLFYPSAHSDTGVKTDTDKKAKTDFYNATILVVEDESRVRKVTSRDLRRLGYDVFEAEDAASARQLLEQEQSIELMLTDVLMPGDMDGIQLAEWASLHHPGVKIMLLSGYTSREDSGLGDFPLVLKPYVFENLAEELEGLLSCN